MEAKNLYWKIAKSVLGNDLEIPAYSRSNGGGVRWKKYIDLDPFSQMKLVACYNGLAACCAREKDFESVRFFVICPLDLSHRKILNIGPDVV